MTAQPARRVAIAALWRASRAGHEAAQRAVAVLNKAANRSLEQAQVTPRERMIVVKALLALAGWSCDATRSSGHFECWLRNPDDARYWFGRNGSIAEGSTPARATAVPSLQEFFEYVAVVVANEEATADGETTHL